MAVESADIRQCVGQPKRFLCLVKAGGADIVGGDHDNYVSCIDDDWISMRAVSGHGGGELALGLAEEQALASMNTQGLQIGFAPNSSLTTGSR